MTRRRPRVTALALVLASTGLLAARPGAQSSTAPAIQPAAAKLPALGADKVITEADCTAEKIGTIPVAAIGEPVGAHLGGLGLAIISTSKGVVSGSDAANTGIGGEVLCQVW